MRPPLLFLLPSSSRPLQRLAMGMASCIFVPAGLQAAKVMLLVGMLLHSDHLRRRELATINEPWFKASAQGVNAAKASQTKPDKVAELKEKLLAERIKSGAASFEEAVAYNLAQTLKKEALKRKNQKK